MIQKLTTVRFLHSGWCSQFARLVGEKSWKWSRFHAIFVYIEHPVHGGCLIDTAYSDEFFKATRGFPQRTYRWLTPVCLDEPPSPWGRLQAAGIDPAGVQRIFVSHFHADHVAGLKCFPHASFVYRQAAHDHIIGLPVRTQVRHGFLQSLLPQDFRDRGQPIDESKFRAGDDVWSDFQVLDYWGDGSLLLVDLPGHADGHFGFVLNGTDRPEFYIVDACWHVQVMKDQLPLPWISRRFQHDPAAYFETQRKLNRLAVRTEIELLACHCPRTLDRVV